MRDYSLVSEALEYQTSPDPTNTDARYLIGGSQNVLIDYQRKVKIRGGYSRLGAANTALTPIRKGVTWNSSTGLELPVRFYGALMEVYLGTVDGTAVSAWTQVAAGLSVTAIPRLDTWYDTGENLDILLWVQSDDNIYEWGGGVAVATSITSNSVTKAGTSTFAQNRFYATRSMAFINLRTGIEYAYTGGAGTTTLTSVSPDPTGDIVAGDILMQKIVTNTDEPTANRINDTLLVFENQLVLGSFTDNEVVISKNTDFKDFAFSAPRTAGEGGLLTLDAPSGGFGIISKTLVCFSGRSSLFRSDYEQITVGAVLAETLKVKKLKSGVDQGALSPDCIIPIGNSLAYISYEPALRELNQGNLSDEPELKTLSNPIKPDFDAEDWDNAQGLWYKNALYLSAQDASHVYILEFQQDANGKLRRYWQPPQILPVSSLVVISNTLHGHSNSVPETYNLSSGTYSDISSDDAKLPINAIAKFAYNVYGKRGLLKNHDEYYNEGEINAATDDLLLDLSYDYGGFTQTVEKTIDGTDEDILEEFVGSNSLAQASLGTQPLGGLLNTPSDARRFRVVFEMPREDYYMLQATYSTNEVDRYWAILSHGPNVVLSKRKNTVVKK